MRALLFGPAGRVGGISMTGTVPRHCAVEKNN